MTIPLHPEMEFSKEKIDIKEDVASTEDDSPSVVVIQKAEEVATEVSNNLSMYGSSTQCGFWYRLSLPTITLIFRCSPPEL